MFFEKIKKQGRNFWENVPGHDIMKKINEKDE
jgi:hypothetical protein